jgi:hypothetical protein
MLFKLTKEQFYQVLCDVEVCDTFDFQTRDDEFAMHIGIEFRDLFDTDTILVGEYGYDVKAYSKIRYKTFDIAGHIFDQYAEDFIYVEMEQLKNFLKRIVYKKSLGINPDLDVDIFKVVDEIQGQYNFINFQCREVDVDKVKLYSIYSGETLLLDIVKFPNNKGITIK